MNVDTRLRGVAVYVTAQFKWISENRREERALRMAARILKNRINSTRFSRGGMSWWRRVTLVSTTSNSNGAGSPRSTSICVHVWIPPGGGGSGDTNSTRTTSGKPSTVGDAGLFSCSIQPFGPLPLPERRGSVKTNPINMKWYQSPTKGPLLCNKLFNV